MSLNEKQIEERKHLITASMVSSIVGLNPYQTPWDCWAVKTGLVEQKPATIQMDLGSALQEPIQRVANKHLGLNIIPNTMDLLSHHPTIHWAAATPDGTIKDRPIINEVKLVGRGTDWRDGVPDYVQCQVQWQMACCQAESCIVLALVWSRLQQYEVDFSPELFEALRERCELFYNEHLVKGIPPPVDQPEAIVVPKEKHKTIIEADIEDVGLFSFFEEYDKMKKTEVEAKKTKASSFRSPINRR